MIVHGQAIDDEEDLLLRREFRQVEPDRREQLDARRLHEVEIGAVVDHAARVGVVVVHPHRPMERAAVPPGRHAVTALDTTLIPTPVTTLVRTWH